LERRRSGREQISVFPFHSHIVVMRYLIKDKETGRFLSRAGDWTRYSGEARQFPNGLSVALHLEPLNLDQNTFELVRINPL
jgi:hypothetical protein